MSDLFNSYWDNPKKQGVYANFNCPGSASESEIKFNINDSTGEISNNKDVLASIDMSNISSSLTNWNVTTKTIQPNSFLCIDGNYYGDSYKRVVYGNVADFVVNNEFTRDLKLYISLQYMNGSMPQTEVFSVMGNKFDQLISKANNHINEIGAKISCNHIIENDKNLISFESLSLGYDFYIDAISLCIPCDEDEINECESHVGCNNYHEYSLEEYVPMFIPSHKYVNGAYKGLLITTDYPKYSNGISACEKSLMIGHFKNRVTLFDKCHNNMFRRRDVDVYKDMSLQEEYKSCITFNDRYYFDIDDNWLNDNENVLVNIQNGIKVKRSSIMGFYGYCDYLTRTNGWHKFGPIYSIVGTDDVENEVTYNYIPTAIIYNPNNFPVKVNAMTWQ